MKKNLFIVLGIVVLIVVIGRFFSNADITEKLELISYDLRFQLTTDTGILGKHFKKADKDIVIVAIDDYSKKELLNTTIPESGVRPWEKDVWKHVLDFIEEGQPKTVMFNMVFEKSSHKPWYDSSFSYDLRKYNNTVLGTYLDEPLKKDTNFTKKIFLVNNDNIPTGYPLNVIMEDPKIEEAITYTINAPVSNLYTQYNDMGVINSVLDKDENIRKNQPIFKLVKDGKTYYMPSIAFAGFLKYMGGGTNILIRNQKIFYKDREIPLNKDGTVTLNRHEFKRSYSIIPISKILLNNHSKHDLKPDYFKNKLVIIGKTASGKDINLDSIINSNYISPENTALAVDNYVNDSIADDKNSRGFVSEAPKPLEIIVTIIACVVVAILGLVSKSAFIGCINGAFSILLYLFFCFWIFVHPSSRIMMPIVVPVFYITITSGIVFAFRFYKETHRKNSLMNTFGKFVSPKVFSTVVKNPANMVLKNTKKRITILFCDVKDFSNMCEKYPPEKLVSNLNDLFKEIVNIIFENKGTVDKFIGDCVMAYWGDLTDSEDHEFMAVKTALEIKKRIGELKILNAQQDKIIFDVKMGINTGDAVLGLAGTDKIMSYTAMGDAVNTASRLESYCSVCQKDILISKSTYEPIKDKIVTLEVGKISLKGKDELVEAYEPIGLVEEEEQLI